MFSVFTVNRVFESLRIEGGLERDPQTGNCRGLGRRRKLDGKQAAATWWQRGLQRGHRNGTPAGRCDCWPYLSVEVSD